jgi:single-strand DNA-binding protein
MSNFNKVVLVGNLVTEPELKEIGDNNSVVRFRMAINRRYTTKSGEKKEDTTYIDCEMWGPRAGVIAEYVKKADPILVEGHLKQENWENKDGEKRSKILVSIEDFEFLQRRNSEQKESSEKSTVKTSKKIGSSKSSEKNLEDIPF